jgi:flagellar protein FliS
MLYDGAIRFLHQSAAALRAGRREVAREKLHRAQAIINELTRSLDFRQGEIAWNLRNIYSYCSRHLIDATLHADPDGYDKVAELLTELRDGFAEAERTSESLVA